METEIKWKDLSKSRKVRTVLKGTVMVAGAVCVGSVVTLGIKNCIPTSELSRFNKAMFVVGSTLLVGAAGDIGGEQAAGVFEAMVTPIERGIKTFKSMRLSKEPKSEIVVVAE